jgi:muramoyltetrapeptide carboxypeptidase
MPVTMDSADGLSLRMLKDLLTGVPGPVYEFGGQPLNRPGACEGEIIGGNLSLLCSNAGTLNDFDTTGKILFLEETDEFLYRIDRMAVQLKRNGKLANLAGIIVGQMTRIRDDDNPFGKTAFEIFSEHVNEFGYPAAYAAPIGHGIPNFPLPAGRHARLLVFKDKVSLSFKK